MTVTTERRHRVTPHCELVLPADADRLDWLAARKTGIGASEASAVAGLNRWASPLSVWLDKLSTEPLSDEPPSEAAELGHLMEPIVAEMFSRRTGKRLARVGLVRSIEWPWLLASCDRRVIGAPEAVECKTTSAFLAHEWADDEIPDHAVVQATHQLAVTGWEAVHVPVLFGGRNFQWRTVHRSDVLTGIDDLVAVTHEFWHTNVLGQVEPPAKAMDLPNLRERHVPDPDAPPVQVNAELVAVIREREAARSRKAAADKQSREADKDVKAATARLTQLVGNAPSIDAGADPLMWIEDRPRKGFTVQPGVIRTYTLTEIGTEHIHG